MTITKKEYNEVIDLLLNQFPRYSYNWAVRDTIPYHLLHFEGYEGIKSFKNNFGKKVDDVLFFLKKLRSKGDVSNTEIRLLIEQLSKVVDSYKTKVINKKEFKFQPSTEISVHEGLINYYTIEKVEKEFFNEISSISQLKYDYTVKFIDGLKEVLTIPAQPELEKEELNIDEFFELILDHAPHYKSYDEEVQDDLGNWKAYYIIEYQDYKHPADYYLCSHDTARKVLMHFRKEHAQKNLSDEYINGYLQELKFERDNFVMRKMNGKEYKCHSNAYCSSPYMPNDERKQLEVIKADWAIEPIKLYNEYRYNIIKYLIDGFEKILKKEEGNSTGTNLSATFSKLEIDLSVSDIALLYRLLHEEGLINNKTKTDIYKYISSTIKSKNQANISADSIKNKFLSPDSSSLQKLETLLVNLRQTLKKIQ